MQNCYGRHVSRTSVNKKWFIDLLHGVILLPDATSYDKYIKHFHFIDWKNTLDL